MIKIREQHDDEQDASITRKQLCSYVAKTLQDAEIIARINDQRKIAGSWVQRTIDELYKKLADPLNVDFEKLAEVEDE